MSVHSNPGDIVFVNNDGCQLHKTSSLIQNARTFPGVKLNMQYRHLVVSGPVLK